VEYRGSQAEAGELGNPEVAHYGRIRQQEKRFCDDRAKCRNGETEDFPGVPAGGNSPGGGA
jgi:hypothetical protein